MQLYVKHRSGREIRLDITARSRHELVQKVGYRFRVNSEWYTVNDVYARAGTREVAGGALIGGLLGIVGGGVGVLVGGLAGGVLGGMKDEKEKKVIDQFNHSLV